MGTHRPATTAPPTLTIDEILSLAGSEQAVPAHVKRKKKNEIRQ
jgi:hypothetical protein